MIDEFEAAMENGAGSCGFFGGMKAELGSELQLNDNEGRRPRISNTMSAGAHFSDESDPFDGEGDISHVPKIRQVNSFSTLDPTWNMIRILAYDFGDQCSLHGIYALFSKRTITAKILWAFAILFMNGLFFFYFYDLLQDAVLQDPPATSTSLKYDQQRVVHFPRLSVCDPNPDNNKVDSYFDENAGEVMRFLLGIAYSPIYVQFKHSVQRNIAESITQHPQFNDTFNNLNVSQLSTDVKMRYKIGDTLEETLHLWKDASLQDTDSFDDSIGSALEFFSDIGPQLDQLVKFCLWKGNDCSTNSFWNRELTSDGFCWVFNPTDDEVYTAGQSQALHLILDAEAELGSPLFNNFLGVSLDINDRSSTVTSTDDSQEILLAPGTSYLLSFRISQFTDDSNTVECISEGTPGVLEYFSEYTFPACIDECLSNSEVEACGCRELGLPYAEEDYPNVCNMFQTLMCNMKKTDILKRCYSQCKPQCDFSRYEFQKSFGTFPGPLAAVYNLPVFFGNSTSYDYMRENMVEVRIFLDDMFIMKSKVERQYEVFSIISGAGGLAGLFTGASMLTVFEIIELVVNVLHLLLIRLSYKFRKYTPQQNVSSVIAVGSDLTAVSENSQITESVKTPEIRQGSKDHEAHDIDEESVKTPEVFHGSKVHKVAVVAEVPDISEVQEFLDIAEIAQ